MKTAEKILNDRAREHKRKYASFCALIENESSVDVFDIVIKAMEKYADQQVEYNTKILLKIIETYEELDGRSGTYVLNDEPLINQHTEDTYLRLKLELLKKEAGL